MSNGLNLSKRKTLEIKPRKKISVVSSTHEQNSFCWCSHKSDLGKYILGSSDIIRCQLKKKLEAGYLMLSLRRCSESTSVLSEALTLQFYHFLTSLFTTDNLSRWCYGFEFVLMRNWSMARQSKLRSRRHHFLLSPDTPYLQGSIQLLKLNKSRDQKNTGFNISSLKCSDLKLFNDCSGAETPCLFFGFSSLHNQTLLSYVCH